MSGALMTLLTVLACTGHEPAERTPQPGCGTIERLDSGLPGFDAAATRADGWLPTITRSTDLRGCAAWREPAALAAPRAGRAWRVAWRWRVWDDPAVPAVTDFRAPHFDYYGVAAVTAHRIYVTAGDSAAGVAALSHSGRLLWGRQVITEGLVHIPKADDQAWLATSPVATPDEGVLIATNYNRLVHFAPDGTERWRLVPPVVGYDRLGGPGPQIALGPNGMIYWALIGSAALIAADRCGQVHWRADGPEGAWFGRLMVDGVGVLFAHSGDAIFRFEPDGSVRRVYTNPEAYAGQRVELAAIGLDGTLQLRAGSPRETLSEPWGYESQIDGVTGEILNEVRYQRIRDEARTGTWVRGATEPFGFFGTYWQITPEYRQIAHWNRRGDDSLLTFPPELARLSAGPDGPIRTGCDGFVLVSDGVEVTGIVRTEPTGRVESMLGDDERAYGRAVLDPSGLLVIVNTFEVVGVETDATPGPGWSHDRANAWNSSSLAVAPP